MPRTKQAHKEPNKNMLIEILIKQVRDQEALILKELENQDMIHVNYVADLKTFSALLKTNYSKYLNARLKDFDLINISNSLSITNSSQKRGRPKLKRSISDTAINDSKSLLQSTSKYSSVSNDSGNSTASSLSGGATSHSAVRSGSSARIKATTSTTKSRRSRSLSRNSKRGLPTEFGTARSTMRTPLQTQRLPIMTPITPKMKNCNEIPAVLRRPKQNEIAVSLHGSPLMVNAVMDGINANIPLSDGRVIALQPQNMRFSDIADMSLAPESISDLQLLRDNLARLCENFDAKAKKGY